jgi:DNA-binding PadR family transcriptional regulator
MNELLILYILHKSQTTMYGLSKLINKDFGSITKPSFGTLQPALKKLEKLKYIFSSKFYTEGGKPYFYYSLTKEGEVFLETKLLEKNSSNPTQFLTMTRIKIACSDILEQSKRIELYKSLKTILLKLKIETENCILTNSATNNSNYKLVLNNVLCEYNNLINLIERL